jgi:NhaP-type Na+/H+ or K+/H+ antiporter
MPQMFEASAAAVIIYLVFDMPWGLCFACGFMMGAVSPAVVVPSCIRLRNMGYGVTKGVSGIIIAAASLDDILAISMFGIFLGVGMSGTDSHGIFPGDALTNAILMGPFEIVGGVLLGIIIGVFLRLDFF